MISMDVSYKCMEKLVKMPPLLRGETRLWGLTRGFGPELQWLQLFMGGCVFAHHSHNRKRRSCCRCAFAAAEDAPQGTLPPPTLRTTPEGGSWGLKLVSGTESWMEGDRWGPHSPAAQTKGDRWRLRGQSVHAGDS